MNYTFKAFGGTMNEGNAFSAALKKAKDAGEKEFEVDGETYKVEESDENKEEPKAPKLMSFDDFVKDKSTISNKSDDTSAQKVATDDEVNAKLPDDKEEKDLEDKEARDNAKGKEEEEEEEADDLEDLNA
jgi:hypothetical protein